MTCFSDLPITVRVVLFAGLYFVLVWVSLLLVIPSVVVVAFWAPGGFFLAALLLSEKRRWLMIAAACFVGGVTGGWMHGHLGWLSIGYEAANTLAALVAAHLISSQTSPPITLERVQQVVVFAGAGLVSGALSATVAAALTIAAQPSSSFGTIWRTWAMATWVGMLVVAPLFLTVSAIPFRKPLPTRLIEGILLFGGVTLTTFAVFGRVIQQSEHLVSPAYMVFPLLIWAALRFMPTGTAIAVFLVAIISLWGTLEQRGYMALMAASVEGQIILLQVYQAIIALTAFVVAAATAERRRALEALAKRESDYRVLVEQASDGIFITDPDGHFIDVNSRGCEILGYTREELLQMSSPDRLFPDDALFYPWQFEDMRQGDIIFSERTLHRKDGTPIPVEVSAKMLPDGRFQGILRDISERKRVEEALRDSEERYRTLVETSPYSIALIDLNGIILFCNQQTAKLYGFQSAEEMIGVNAFEFVAPGELARAQDLFKQALEMGRIEPIEITLTRRDGTIFPAEGCAACIRDAEGNPRALISVVSDITERKRLEERILQAHKMDSIGRLAGGVAHDFNNLLTAVIGFAEIAQAQIESDHPAQSSLENVIKAGERASNLTRQLLAFARRQPTTPRVLDLNTVLLNLEKILHRLLGEQIELRLDLSDNLGAIKADQAQMEQVALNLTTNARDAMPSGGTLTIETRNVDLSEGDLRHYPNLYPGAYVQLTVRDTGHGMDEKTLQHLFEPFFSTKGIGRGTGLGLATCYGIVTQAGGSIYVESRPEQGTTFRILMPRIEEPVSESLVPDRLREAPPRGTETILLTEDEPVVRHVAAQMLQQLGYTVIEAGHGEEALNRFSEHGSEIDLLLTDVVMPRMGGVALAERLRASHPHLKVLFISGYMDHRILQEQIAARKLPYLLKPFTHLALARKVREVLDG